MTRKLFVTALLAATALVAVPSAWAGQAPAAASAPDIPISNHDRVYAAEQFSAPKANPNLRWALKCETPRAHSSNSSRASHPRDAGRLPRTSSSLARRT
jgi:hypothetical protein